MDTLAIFGLQLVLSLIVYTLMAKWYVAPWLAEKPIHLALIALIFPRIMLSLSTERGMTDRVFHPHALHSLTSGDSRADHRVS